MRTKRKETDVPSALKTINVKAILRSRGVYLRQQQNQELKEMMKPIARKILNGKTKKVVVKDSEDYTPPAHTKFTAEEIMDYRNKQLHDIAVVEEHFDTAVQKYLEYVNSKLVDKLEAEIEAKKSIATKDVFDDNEDDFLSKAQLDFTPLLENLGVIAGQDAYKMVGVSDPYMPSSQLRKLIESNVEKFTKSMLDTDRKYITDIITDGVENGQSVVEIRNTLTEDTEFTKMQSTRITRTEVLRASTQSAKDAWIQSGVVEGKQWITAGATDECADYEGQIETLSANFYADTSEFADGDPPIHPNCRCTLIPIVMGAEERNFVDNRKTIENLKEIINDLETKVDKRTKGYKKIKSEQLEDRAYIKALEGLVGEPSTDT